MADIEKQYVDKTVDGRRPKKRRRRLPRNVVEKADKWYVRKSVSVLGRSHQVWRICEPKTPERVLEVLRDIEAEIDFARTGVARPLSRFSEVAAEFEESELCDPIYENGKIVAGRRSIEAPRIMLRTLVEYFGEVEIDRISFGDLERYKAERLRTPVRSKYKLRPRSIRGVNYELSFLRQIFSFAVRRRWLDRSPFTDGRNLIDVAAETRRHVSLSRDEERRLLELSAGNKLFAHFRPVIVCILDGGFRIGELLAAKWSDVDFDDGVIYVRSYKGRSLRSRPIYLTARMKAELLAWREIQPTIDKVSDCSLVIGYASVKKGWLRLREAIDRPDLRIHDLRHVFATRLHFDAKVPVALVSAALGHSSQKTTEIYINAQGDDLREAIAKLDLIIDLDK